MTPLEKAARAAMAHEWGHPISDNQFDATNRAYWEAHVRAVLMAVREPENAGKLSAIGNAIWRERIDAILAEPQP